MEYFLSIAGERSGPCTQFQLIERIREGTLDGTELAWHKGSPDWLPLKKLEEFAPYWPLTAEQLAQAHEARRIARVSLDTPQPWLRFWARMVDYVWFGLLLIALASVTSYGQKIFLSTTMGLNALMFLTHFLFVPLEAWWLARHGTTPGKSLLRIQVQRQEGGLVVYRQALRRALLVYLKGIALGLPIPALITMSFSRVKLMQTGTTSWDRDCQTRVEHGEPEMWRFVLVLMLVFAVLIASSVVAFTMNHEVMEELRSRLPK